MFETIKKEYIPRPAGADFVHASTNLVLRDGTVLLAWFGGSKEGNDDVSIYCAKRDGRGVWKEPRKLEDHIPEPHWNPVLFPLDEKTLVLFYKIGKKIHEWRTYFCLSEDQGESFSGPRELVPGDTGGRGPVRNKPIRLFNGDILAPASVEKGIWHAFVDFSTDNGKTWTTGPDIRIADLTYNSDDIVISEDSKKIPVSEQSFFGRGVIQPSLWESEEGHVHMLLRSTEGAIYRSDSEDSGRTWSAAYATELPNNNSGIDLVRTQGGVLALVYNPVGKNWGPRSPISLALSRDNGTSWNKVADLESGEGEFSYPAITSVGDRIFISYSYKREAIAFREMSLAK